MNSNENKFIDNSNVDQSTICNTMSKAQKDFYRPALAFLAVEY